MRTRIILTEEEFHALAAAIDFVSSGIDGADDVESYELEITQPLGRLFNKAKKAKWYTTKKDQKEAEAKSGPKTGTLHAAGK